MTEKISEGSKSVVLAAGFALLLIGVPALLLVGPLADETPRKRLEWTAMYVVGVMALTLFFAILEGAIRRVQDESTARRYRAGTASSVEAAMRFVCDYHRAQAGEFTRSEEGRLIERVTGIFGLSEETAAGIVFTGADHRRWNPAA